MFVTQIHEEEVVEQEESVEHEKTVEQEDEKIVEEIDEEEILEKAVDVQDKEEIVEHFDEEEVVEQEKFVEHEEETADQKDEEKLVEQIEAVVTEQERFVEHEETIDQTDEKIVEQISEEEVLEQEEVVEQEELVDQEDEEMFVGQIHEEEVEPKDAVEQEDEKIVKEIDEKEVDEMAADQEDIAEHIDEHIDEEEVVEQERFVEHEETFDQKDEEESVEHTDEEEVNEQERFVEQEEIVEEMIVQQERLAEQKPVQKEVVNQREDEEVTEHKYEQEEIVEHVMEVDQRDEYIVEQTSDALVEQRRMSEEEIEDFREEITEKKDEQEDIVQQKYDIVEKAISDRRDYEEDLLDQKYVTEEEEVADEKGEEVIEKTQASVENEWIVVEKDTQEQIGVERSEVDKQLSEHADLVAEKYEDLPDSKQDSYDMTHEQEMEVAVTDEFVEMSSDKLESKLVSEQELDLRLKEKELISEREFVTDDDFEERKTVEHEIETVEREERITETEEFYESEQIVPGYVDSRLSTEQITDDTLHEKEVEVDREMIELEPQHVGKEVVSEEEVQESEKIEGITEQPFAEETETLSEVSKVDVERVEAFERKQTEEVEPDETKDTTEPDSEEFRKDESTQEYFEEPLSPAEAVSAFDKSPVDQTRMVTVDDSSVEIERDDFVSEYDDKREQYAVSMDTERTKDVIDTTFPQFDEQFVQEETADTFQQKEVSRFDEEIESVESEHDQFEETVRKESADYEPATAEIMAVEQVSQEKVMVSGETPETLHVEEVDVMEKEKVEGLETITDSDLEGKEVTKQIIEAEVFEETVEEQEIESVFSEKADKIVESAVKEVSEGDVLVDAHGDEKEESESEAESVEAPAETQEIIFLDKATEEVEIVEQETVEQSDIITSQVSIEHVEETVTSHLVESEQVDEPLAAEVISQLPAEEEEELLESEEAVAIETITEHTGAYEKSEEVVEERLEESVFERVAAEKVIEDEEPSEPREVVQEDIVKTEIVETVSAQRVVGLEETIEIREVSREQVTESLISDTDRSEEHVHVLTSEPQLEVAESREFIEEESVSDVDQVEAVSVTSDQAANVQDGVIPSATEQQIATTFSETKEELLEETLEETPYAVEQTTEEEQYLESGAAGEEPVHFETTESVTGVEDAAESHVTLQEHVKASIMSDSDEVETDIQHTHKVETVKSEELFDKFHDEQAPEELGGSEESEVESEFVDDQDQIVDKEEIGDESEKMEDGVAAETTKEEMFEKITSEAQIVEEIVRTDHTPETWDLSVQDELKDEVEVDEEEEPVLKKLQDTEQQFVAFESAETDILEEKVQILDRKNEYESVEEIETESKTKAVEEIATAEGDVDKSHILFSQEDTMQTDRCFAETDEAIEEFGQEPKDHDEDFYEKEGDDGTDAAGDVQEIYSEQRSVTEESPEYVTEHEPELQHYRDEYREDEGIAAAEAAAPMLEDEGYDEIMEDRIEEQADIQEKDGEFVESDHKEEVEQYERTEYDDDYERPQEYLKTETVETHDSEVAETCKTEVDMTYVHEEYSKTTVTTRENIFEQFTETNEPFEKYSDTQDITKTEVDEAETFKLGYMEEMKADEEPIVQEREDEEHVEELKAVKQPEVPLEASEDESDDDAWEMLEKDELSEEELMAASDELLMQVSVTSSDIQDIPEQREFTTDSHLDSPKQDISDEELVEKEPFSPFETKKSEGDRFEPQLPEESFGSDRTEKVEIKSDLPTKELDHVDGMKESESALDMAEVEIVSVDDGASYQNRIDQVIVDQASFEMEGEPVEVDFKSGSSELSDEDLKERKLSASEFAQSQVVAEEQEDACELALQEEQIVIEEPQQETDLLQTEAQADDVDIQTEDVDEEFAETEEPELEKLAETEDADEFSDASPSFEGPVEQGYITPDLEHTKDMHEKDTELIPEQVIPAVIDETGHEIMEQETIDSERPHRPEPGTDTHYMVTATPEQPEKITPSELDLGTEDEPKSEKEYQQTEEKDVESPVIKESEEERKEQESESLIQEKHEKEGLPEDKIDEMSSDEASVEIEIIPEKETYLKEDSDVSQTMEVKKEDLLTKSTRIEFSETQTESVQRVEVYTSESEKQTELYEEFDSFKHRDEITQKEDKTDLFQSEDLAESHKMETLDTASSLPADDTVAETYQTKSEVDVASSEPTIGRSDLDIETTETSTLIKSELDLDTAETRPEPEELELQEDKEDIGPTCAEAELITSSLEPVEDHERAESIETESVDSQQPIDQIEEPIPAAEQAIQAEAVPWASKDIQDEGSDEISSDEDDLGASREPTSDSDTIPDDAKFDDEDVSPSKLEEVVTYEEHAVGGKENITDEKEVYEETVVQQSQTTEEMSFESFSFTQRETVIEHTATYFSDDEVKFPKEEKATVITEKTAEQKDLEDIYRPEETETYDTQYEPEQTEEGFLPSDEKGVGFAGVTSIESSMTTSIYEPADFDDTQEPDFFTGEYFVDRREEFTEEMRTSTEPLISFENKVQEDKDAELVFEETFIDRKEFFLEEITETMAGESAKKEGGDSSIDLPGGVVDDFEIRGPTPTSGPSTDKTSSSDHAPVQGDMTDRPSSPHDGVYLALHPPLLPTSSTEVQDRSRTPSDIEPDELDIVPEKKVVHSDSNERAVSPLEYSYEARHPFEESDITGASADDEMEPEGRITADTSQQIFIEQTIESRKPPKVGGYSSGEEDEDRPPSPSEFTLVQSHDQDMLMKALGIDQTIDEDRSSEEESESESESEGEEDRPPSPTEFTLVASQDQDTLAKTLLDESEPDYALQEEHLIYIQDADMPPKIGFGDDMLRDPLSDGFTTGTSSAEAPDASEQSSSEQAQKETLDQSVDNNTMSTLSSELNEQAALEPTAPPLSSFEETSEEVTVMTSSYEKIYQGLNVETKIHTEQILDIGDHFDTKQPDLHFQSAGRSSSFEDLYQQEETVEPSSATEEIQVIKTEQEEKLSFSSSEVAQLDDIREQAARGEEEEEEDPEMMEGDESMSSMNSSLTGATGEESTRLLLKKEVHTKTTIGPDGREETLIKEDLQVRQDNDPPEELRDSMQEIINQFMETDTGNIPKLPEERQELEDDV